MYELYKKKYMHHNIYNKNKSNYLNKYRLSFFELK